MASTSPLSLLKEPSVAPLFLSRLIASAGVGFGQLALAWGVMGTGYGAGGLSLVLTCNSLPALLILFGGIAGDRFRRHHVLVAAELIASSAWLGLGACFLSGRAPLFVLCALSLLAGVAIALFLPTIRGIVADLMAGERRPAGNALISQTQSLGLLIGLASSGLVVSALGAGWAALARGVLCAISACLLGRLKTSRWSSAERGLLRELRGGWREFTAHRWVWLVSLQYTAVIIATVCYSDIAGPLYMAQGHGGAKAWGFITASEALGALAGAFVGARWRPSRPLLAVAALPAAAAVPMLMMASGAPWATLVVASVIPGACQAVYYVVWTTALQNTYPPNVLVRVNSWNIVASYALMPVTLLAAGPLVKALGPSMTTLGAGSLVLASTVAALIALRSTSGSAPSISARSKPFEESSKPAGAASPVSL
ncbi:MFS transporter [Spirillospora sp. NPDC050679]